MSRPADWLRELFHGRVDWARLFCMVLSLFVIQGVIVLGFYALRGADQPPEALPTGLQLDPIHAVIHLVTGLVAAFFAFGYPRRAAAFLRAFAIFYLALAILGTFTDIHFGMQLELPENALHWSIGTLAAVIGYAPLLGSAPHGS
jgi:hypothetical protein